MAEMESFAAGRKRKSFSHTRKQLPRIDMTPMVDLGFLLITFFIFTTTMSTPTVTDLFMPNDNKPDPEPPNVANSLALTILLDENNIVYYYNGQWEDAKTSKMILQTNYSTWKGIGKVIREKQREVAASGKFAGGKNDIMILIKPAPGSVYKNVVDALDEMMINDVKKYAIIEPTGEEKEFLDAKARSGQ